MSKIEINELVFRRYGNVPKVDSVNPTSYHYIITEGQNSELMYLNALIEKNILTLNSVKIIPLQRTGKIARTSDPYNLKEFALSFRKMKTENKEIEKNDKFYVMFDRDSFKSWTKPKEEYLKYLDALDSINLLYLVSSPCIEFWLLLHRDDVYRKSLEKTYSDNMFKNKVIKKGRKTLTFAQKKCIEVLKFDPKCEMDSKIVEYIEHAIIQSESFENDPRKLCDSLGSNLGEYFKTFIKLTDKS